MDKVVELKNITKQFNGTKVIDNVDLSLNKGETLAIIGPSGCGKSTLLKLIVGLYPPTKGIVNIKGININTLDEIGLSKVREMIGMVFQSSALFDSLSVYDNISFGIIERMDLHESKIKKIVAEKLEMVGLEGTQDLMPAELSGGMQKRISLARALATDPEIMLYDEPTTGLDPVTSASIEELIKSIHSKLGSPAIVVTHQLSTVYRVSDRIVMLNEGKIIESGTPKETMYTKNNIIKKFISAGQLEKL